MNFFSKTFLKRHQLKLFFVTIWLHISTLDLFYVTYRGPVFLWHENSQWLTLTVHFFIALFTTCLYWLVNERAQVKRIAKRTNNDKDTGTNTSKNKPVCEVKADSKINKTQ